MLVLPEHLQRSILSTLGPGHFWQAAECFRAGSLYTGLFEPTTFKTCQQCARTGDLAGLIWSHTQSCPWEISTTAAAAFGHFECLVYAVKHGAPVSEVQCMAAARGGHLQCLKYLMKVTHTDHPFVIREAAQGSLECLAYLHRELGLPIHNEVAEVAAGAGRLDCLMYAHKQGCSFDAATELAARGGHLDCMKYAYKHGAEWAEMTLATAAKYSHWDCWQYAHEHGCPINHGFDTFYAAKAGNLQILQVMWAESVSTSTTNSTIDLTINWNDTTILGAARYGHFECLKFLHEVAQCPFDHGGGSYFSSEAAAAGGSLQCLQYVHEHGGNFSNTLITKVAADTGNFECLKYAHEHGAPWHPNVLQNANTFEFVEYAHEHGAPWHPNVTNLAAKRGDLECLKYAHEHGAPWHPDVLENANTLACVKYAHEHGATDPLI